MLTTCAHTVVGETKAEGTQAKTALLGPQVRSLSNAPLTRASLVTVADRKRVAPTMPSPTGPPTFPSGLLKRKIKPSYVNFSCTTTPVPSAAFLSPHMGNESKGGAVYQSIRTDRRVPSVGYAQRVQADAAQVRKWLFDTRLQTEAKAVIKQVLEQPTPSASLTRGGRLP